MIKLQYETLLLVFLYFYTTHKIFSIIRIFINFFFALQRILKSLFQQFFNFLTEHFKVTEVTPSMYKTQQSYDWQLFNYLK